VKNGGANNGSGATVWSSVRASGPPSLARKIWILGSHVERMQIAVQAITEAGHQAKAGEPGVELGPVLKDFKPDVIVIDMADQPDRGRHAALQLRADRATRQLPIILVGVPSAEGPKADRAVTGPTRRYINHLDTPSVLNSLICDL
jgi:CheY-like chemotaxis protein